MLLLLFLIVVGLELIDILLQIHFHKDSVVWICHIGSDLAVVGPTYCVGIKSSVLSTERRASSSSSLIAKSVFRKFQDGIAFFVFATVIGKRTVLEAQSLDDRTHQRKIGADNKNLRLSGAPKTRTDVRPYR